MDCPKCVGRLEEKALIFRRSSVIPELREASASFELHVDKCFSCGGIWFDRGELDKYLKEKGSSLDSPSLGKELDRDLDQRKGNCPRCHEALTKARAPYDSTLSTDVCKKCNGIWLDPTEVDRLENVANRVQLGFLELFLKAFKRPKEMEGMD